MSPSVTRLVEYRARLGEGGARCALLLSRNLQVGPQGGGACRGLPVGRVLRVREGRPRRG